jgi:hypothetical protein
MDAIHVCDAVVDVVGRIRHAGFVKDLIEQRIAIDKSCGNSLVSHRYYYLVRFRRDPADESDCDPVPEGVGGPPDLS